MVVLEWRVHNFLPPHPRTKGFFGPDNKCIVIKFLSGKLLEYKNAIIKKKNDAVRKVVKTLQLKGKDPIESVLSDVKILNEKEVNSKDAVYVRAYEENILKELVSIFNRIGNRKTNCIEE